jgi:hypothetical protein
MMTEFANVVGTLRDNSFCVCSQRFNEPVSFWSNLSDFCQLENNKLLASISMKGS